MEILEGPGSLLVKASRERDVQRPAQVAGPIAARVGNRAALGVERVAEHIERAQRLGDRLRPHRQVDRRLILGIHHPCKSKAGVCPRELDGRTYAPGR
jgi:hypothetical protein